MNSDLNTVASMFVSAARQFPDRTFLRWCRGAERITWSYADAALRVDALVRRLDEAGVHAGDHVVVHTSQMVPSILFDLACACAGVVFTPIETTSLPAVLDICARTAARAVLTVPERAERSDAYEGHAVLAEDGVRAVSGDVALAIERLAERARRVDRDAIYMLQPTSGTTGGSKLVMRHHAAFSRIATLLVCGFDRTTNPPPRFLMVAALTHGMGQYLLAMAMGCAGELAVTTAIDVGADLEEVRWLDPTYLGLTPRVLKRFFQQLGGAAGGSRIFGPSAKILMTGGAAPDKEQLAVVHRTGVEIVEGYGASEFSVVAMTRPGEWRHDILGHVVDDVQLRVNDSGELLAKTPVLMRGYHGAPELTRAAFTEDGFYKTGDRVELGPHGELKYLGRVVDSFNLFDGSHVAPGPIEDALARLPWVDQVMLLGDQRPYITGLLTLHPELRASGGLTESVRRLIGLDISRVCADLPPNARIRRLALLDERLANHVYDVVGHGKVRRLREAAIRHYAEVVEALYAPSTAGAIIEVPGAAMEARSASRHRRAWLVHVARLGETFVAYTRDISRLGAYVEHAGHVEVPEALVVHVIEFDGASFSLEAVTVRREPAGFALRWTGAEPGLAELARRLGP